jgi:hypothetical protein
MRSNLMFNYRFFRDTGHAGVDVLQTEEEVISHISS